MEINSNILLAFILTLLAGLSTGIGGFLAFFTKRTNTRFLSAAMGFSAGVMIYISFIELFFEGEEFLIEELGRTPGSWLTVGAFFGGIALTGLIDLIVPAADNPHEVHCVEEIDAITEEDLKKKKLHRTGLFSALGITLHNFPEGLVTFMATLHDPALGIVIAVAIALHNIPEGIAVSIPIYYATGSRKKAFAYSIVSGLAEPLGALIGFAVLYPFINDMVLGIVFAAVAGIMVYISFDELLPTAHEYGEHHIAVSGLIAGMFVMAVSLLLFL